MSKHIQKEFSRLKKKILTLSSVVEENIEKAVRSISTRDILLTEEVFKNEKFVNLCEVEVEEECLKILALYQPVAMDLRFVISVLKINNDLERIGDLAVHIARRSSYLTQEGFTEMPLEFETMEHKTRLMLKNSLDALIELDSSIAVEVCAKDNEINNINKNIYAQVSSRIQESPHNTNYLLHCLSISRHLERIADYATNIAEDVIYMVEGRIIRHNYESEKTFT